MGTFKYQPINIGLESNLFHIFSSGDSGDKNKQDGDGNEQDTKQTGKEKDEDYGRYLFS